MNKKENAIREILCHFLSFSERLIFLIFGFACQIHYFAAAAASEAINCFSAVSLRTCCCEPLSYCRFTAQPVIDFLCALSSLLFRSVVSDCVFFTVSASIKNWLQRFYNWINRIRNVFVCVCVLLSSVAFKVHFIVHTLFTMIGFYCLESSYFSLPFFAHSKRQEKEMESHTTNPPQCSSISNNCSWWKRKRQQKRKMEEKMDYEKFLFMWMLISLSRSLHA